MLGLALRASTPIAIRRNSLLSFSALYFHPVRWAKYTYDSSAERIPGPDIPRFPPYFIIPGTSTWLFACCVRTYTYVHVPL